MRCQFESYPSPQIQWIKLSRTIQDPDGRILAVDIDNDVNDITIKQIGSIIYESVLSVNNLLLFFLNEKFRFSILQRNVILVWVLNVEH
jgi:hypothetical protein